MEPFRFRVAADHARLLADADEALAQALADYADRDIRQRLLAGVAARPDLEQRHVEVVLDHVDDHNPTVLVALLANPVLTQYPLCAQVARRCIGPMSVHLIMSRLDDAAEYLPEMLTACGDEHMDRINEVAIRARFAPAQIDAAVNSLIDRYEAEYLQASPRTGVRLSASRLASLRHLTAAHLDRLVGLIADTLLTPQPTTRKTKQKATTTQRASVHRRAAAAEEALVPLLQRADLPKGASLTLVRCAEALVSAELDQFASRMTPEHRDRLSANRSLNLLRDARLSEEAAIYAITSPTLRLPSTCTRAPAVLYAAIREGRVSPLRLLESDNWFHSAPADILAFVLDAVRDTEDPPWRGMIRVGVDHIGEPVWDDLYAAYLAQPRSPDVPAADVVDMFMDMARGALIEFADRAATPRREALAAWASASDDPLLRRHAVRECWAVAQLAHVQSDPSPLVRVEVLAHPLATAEEVLRAAADPDAGIRLAAAQHQAIDARVIALLAHDADEQVRAQVAGRVLASLGGRR